jgi:flagellar protein FlbD
MIAITYLDGSSAIVNLDLIERIERRPDTLIVLANGIKLIVRETPEELVDRAVAYKRGFLGERSAR